MQRYDLEELETEKGIFFHYEISDFDLFDELNYINWIKKIIEQEKQMLSLLNFIFCNDDYLHKINVSYLNHDTLTDIITFPLAEQPTIEGDIFISIERIRDNAKQLSIPFEEEVKRVIAHGVLHLCGYGDKLPSEISLMREKENQAISIFKK